MPRKIKITALLTAFVFTLTSLGLPSEGFASVKASLSSEVRTASPFYFELPSELGTIQNLSPGNGRTLIHIQSAHGHYEAQKNIQAILHHLKDQYEIPLVLLEGSAFPLEPRLLNLFANQPAWNQKVLDALTREGIVKGAELFLFDDFRRHENRVAAFGIEDLQSYVDNKDAFYALMSLQKEVEFFLEEQNQKRKQSLQKLNPKLKNFIRQQLRYQKEALSLHDWLLYLQKNAKKILNLDLENAFHQLQWPMLVRLFKVQAFEAALDLKAYEKERERLFSILSSSRIKKLLSDPFADHELPDPETGILFENMLDELPKNFDYDDYPNLTLLIGRLILQSEIKTQRLLDEIKTLEKQMVQKLTQSNQEKEILDQVEKVTLLEKLLRLELTPGEWAQARTNVMAQNDMVKHALQFYHLAEKRDTDMLAQIEKRLNDSGHQKAIIITGGFHAEAFRKHFVGKQDNYVQIVPKMTSVEGYQTYINSILDFHKNTLESPYYFSTLTRFFESMKIDLEKLEHFVEMLAIRELSSPQVSDSEARSARNIRNKLTQAFMKRKKEVAVPELGPNQTIQDIWDEPLEILGVHPDVLRAMKKVGITTVREYTKQAYSYEFRRNLLEGGIPEKDIRKHEREEWLRLRAIGAYFSFDLEEVLQMSVSRLKAPTKQTSNRFSELFRVFKIKTLGDLIQFSAEELQAKKKKSVETWTGKVRYERYLGDKVLRHLRIALWEHRLKLRDDPHPLAHSESRAQKLESHEALMGILEKEFRKIEEKEPDYLRPYLAQTQGNVEAARTLQKQIHGQILEAFRAVDRKHFFPEDKAEEIYHDYQKPLGHRGSAISRPTIIARMFSIAGPNLFGKTLELGSASGYTVAIASHLSESVFGVELNEPLTLKAKEIYQDLDIQNAQLLVSDGNFGWIENAPYDLIFIPAEVQRVPYALRAQLKEGGALVLIRGSHMLRYVKKGRGLVLQAVLPDFSFVPFHHNGDTLLKRNLRRIHWILWTGALSLGLRLPKFLSRSESRATAEFKPQLLTQKDERGSNLFIRLNLQSKNAATVNVYSTSPQEAFPYETRSYHVDLKKGTVRRSITRFKEFENYDLEKIQVVEEKTLLGKDPSVFYPHFVGTDSDYEAIRAFLLREQSLKSPRDRAKLQMLRQLSHLFETLNANAQKWRQRSVQIIHKLGAEDFLGDAFAFSSDSKKLAYGGRDSHVVLLDLTTSEKWTWQAHYTGTLNSVAFSPDGTLLATAAGKPDNTINLWNVATREHVRNLRLGHRAAVYALQFSPDGKYLVSGGEDGLVIVWDPHTGEELEQKKVYEQVNAITFLPGDEERVFAVSQYSSRRFIGGRVSIWRIGEEQRQHLSKPDYGYMTDLAFFENGQKAIVAHNSKVSVVEVERGKVLYEYSAPHGWGRVSVSADERLMLLSVRPEEFWRSNKLVFVDTQTGRLVHEFETQGEVRHPVLFLPDGQSFVWQEWDAGKRNRSFQIAKFAPLRSESRLERVELLEQVNHAFLVSTEGLRPEYVKELEQAIRSGYYHSHEQLQPFLDYSNTSSPGAYWNTVKVVTAMIQGGLIQTEEQFDFYFQTYIQERSGDTDRIRLWAAAFQQGVFKDAEKIRDAFRALKHRNKENEYGATFLSLVRAGVFRREEDAFFYVDELKPSLEDSSFHFHQALKLALERGYIKKETEIEKRLKALERPEYRISYAQILLTLLEKGILKTKEKYKKYLQRFKKLNGSNPPPDAEGIVTALEIAAYQAGVIQERPDLSHLKTMPITRDRTYRFFDYDVLLIQSLRAKLITSESELLPLLSRMELEETASEEDAYYRFLDYANVVASAVKMDVIRNGPNGFQGYLDLLAQKKQWFGYSMLLDAANRKGSIQNAKQFKKLIQPMEAWMEGEALLGYNPYKKSVEAAIENNTFKSLQEMAFHLRVLARFKRWGDYASVLRKAIEHKLVQSLEELQPYLLALKKAGQEQLYASVLIHAMDRGVLLKEEDLKEHLDYLYSVGALKSFGDVFMKAHQKGFFSFTGEAWKELYAQSQTEDLPISYLAHLERLREPFNLSDETLEEYKNAARKISQEVDLKNTEAQREDQRINTHAFREYLLMAHANLMIISPKLAKQVLQHYLEQRGHLPILRNVFRLFAFMQPEDIQMLQQFYKETGNRFVSNVNFFITLAGYQSAYESLGIPLSEFGKDLVSSVKSQNEAHNVLGNRVLRELVKGLKIKIDWKLVNARKEQWIKEWDFRHLGLLVYASKMWGEEEKGLFKLLVKAYLEGRANLILYPPDYEKAPANVFGKEYEKAVLQIRRHNLRLLKALEKAGGDVQVWLHPNQAVSPVLTSGTQAHRKPARILVDYYEALSAFKTWVDEKSQSRELKESLPNLLEQTGAWKKLDPMNPDSSLMKKTQLLEPFSNVVFDIQERLRSGGNVPEAVADMARLLEEVLNYREVSEEEEQVNERIWFSDRRVGHDLFTAQCVGSCTALDSNSSAVIEHILDWGTLRVFKGDPMNLEVNAYSRAFLVLSDKGEIAFQVDTEDGRVHDKMLEHAQALAEALGISKDQVGYRMENAEEKIGGALTRSYFHHTTVYIPSSAKPNELPAGEDPIDSWKPKGGWQLTNSASEARAEGEEEADDDDDLTGRVNQTLETQRRTGLILSQLSTVNQLLSRTPRVPGDFAVFVSAFEAMGINENSSVLVIGPDSGEMILAARAVGAQVKSEEGSVESAENTLHFLDVMRERLPGEGADFLDEDIVVEATHFSNGDLTAEEGVPYQWVVYREGVYAHSREVRTVVANNEHREGFFLVFDPEHRFRTPKHFDEMTYESPDPSDTLTSGFRIFADAWMTRHGLSEDERIAPPIPLVSESGDGWAEEEPLGEADFSGGSTYPLGRSRFQAFQSWIRPEREASEPLPSHWLSSMELLPSYLLHSPEGVVYKPSDWERTPYTVSAETAETLMQKASELETITRPSSIAREADAEKEAEKGQKARILATRYLIRYQKGERDEEEVVQEITEQFLGDYPQATQRAFEVLKNIVSKRAPIPSSEEKKNVSQRSGMAIPEHPQWLESARQITQKVQTELQKAVDRRREESTKMRFAIEAQGKVVRMLKRYHVHLERPITGSKSLFTDIQRSLKKKIHIRMVDFPLHYFTWKKKAKPYYFDPETHTVYFSLQYLQSVEDDYDFEHFVAWFDEAMREMHRKKKEPSPLRLQLEEGEGYGDILVKRVEKRLEQDSDNREKLIYQKIQTLEDRIRRLKFRAKRIARSNASEADKRSAYKQIEIAYGQLTLLEESLGQEGWHQKALSRYKDRIAALRQMQKYDTGWQPSSTQKQKVELLLTSHDYAAAEIELKAYLTGATFTEEQKAVAGYPRPLEKHEKVHAYNIELHPSQIREKVKERFLKALNRHRQLLSDQEQESIDRLSERIQQLFDLTEFLVELENQTGFSYFDVWVPIVLHLNIERVEDFSRVNQATLKRVPGLENFENKEIQKINASVKFAAWLWKQAKQAKGDFALWLRVAKEADAFRQDAFLKLNATTLRTKRFSFLDQESRLNLARHLTELRKQKPKHTVSKSESRTSDFDTELQGLIDEAVKALPPFEGRKSAGKKFGGVLQFLRTSVGVERKAFGRQLRSLADIEVGKKTMPLSTYNEIVDLLQPLYDSPETHPGKKPVDVGAILQRVFKVEVLSVPEQEQPKKKKKSKAPTKEKKKGKMSEQDKAFLEEKDKLVAEGQYGALIKLLRTRKGLSQMDVLPVGQTLSRMERLPLMVSKSKYEERHPTIKKNLSEAYRGDKTLSMTQVKKDLEAAFQKLLEVKAAYFHSSDDNRSESRTSDFDTELERLIADAVKDLHLFENKKTSGVKFGAVLWYLRESVRLFQKDFGAKKNSVGDIERGLATMSPAVYAVIVERLQPLYDSPETHPGKKKVNVGEILQKVFKVTPPAPGKAKAITETKPKKKTTTKKPKKEKASPEEIAAFLEEKNQYIEEGRYGDLIKLLRTRKGLSQKAILDLNSGNNLSKIEKNPFILSKEKYEEAHLAIKENLGEAYRGDKTLSMTQVRKDLETAYQRFFDVNAHHFRKLKDPYSEARQSRSEGRVQNTDEKKSESRVDKFDAELERLVDEAVRGLVVFGKGKPLGRKYGNVLRFLRESVNVPRKEFEKKSGLITNIENGGIGMSLEMYELIVKALQPYYDSPETHPGSEPVDVGAILQKVFKVKVKSPSKTESPAEAKKKMALEKAEEDKAFLEKKDALVRDGLYGQLIILLRTRKQVARKQLLPEHISILVTIEKSPSRASKSKLEEMHLLIKASLSKLYFRDRVLSMTKVKEDLEAAFQNFMEKNKSYFKKTNAPLSEARVREEAGSEFSTHELREALGGEMSEIHEVTLNAEGGFSATDEAQTLLVPSQAAIQQMLDWQPPEGESILMHWEGFERLRNSLVDVRHYDMWDEVEATYKRRVDAFLINRDWKKEFRLILQEQEVEEPIQQIRALFRAYYFILDKMEEGEFEPEVDLTLMMNDLQSAFVESALEKMNYKKMKKAAQVRTRIQKIEAHLKEILRLKGVMDEFVGWAEMVEEEDSHLGVWESWESLMEPLEELEKTLTDNIKGLLDKLKELLSAQIAALHGSQKSVEKKEEALDKVWGHVQSIPVDALESLMGDALELEEFKKGLTDQIVREFLVPEIKAWTPKKAESFLDGFQKLKEIKTRFDERVRGFDLGYIDTNNGLNHIQFAYAEKVQEWVKSHDWRVEFERILRKHKGQSPLEAYIVLREAYMSIGNLINRYDPNAASMDQAYEDVAWSFAFKRLGQLLKEVEIKKKRNRTSSEISRMISRQNQILEELNSWEREAEQDLDEVIWRLRQKVQLNRPLLLKELHGAYVQSVESLIQSRKWPRTKRRELGVLREDVSAIATEIADNPSFRGIHQDFQRLLSGIDERIDQLQSRSESRTTDFDSELKELIAEAVKELKFFEKKKTAGRVFGAVLRHLREGVGKTQKDFGAKRTVLRNIEWGSTTMSSAFFEFTVDLLQPLYDSPDTHPGEEPVDVGAILQQVFKVELPKSDKSPAKPKAKATAKKTTKTKMGKTLFPEDAAFLEDIKKYIDEGRYGALVKLLRTRKNINQEDVALEMDRPLISKIETSPFVFSKEKYAEMHPMIKRGLGAIYKGDRTLSMTKARKALEDAYQKFLEVNAHLFRRGTKNPLSEARLQVTIEHPRARVFPLRFEPLWKAWHARFFSQNAFANPVLFRRQMLDVRGLPQTFSDLDSLLYYLAENTDIQYQILTLGSEHEIKQYEDQLRFDFQKRHQGSQISYPSNLIFLPVAFEHQLLSEIDRLVVDGNLPTALVVEDSDLAHKMGYRSDRELLRVAGDQEAGVQNASGIVAAERLLFDLPFELLWQVQQPQDLAGSEAFWSSLTNLSELEDLRDLFATAA